MLWYFGHNVLMIGPSGARKTLLARTTADLAGSGGIQPAHLAEVLWYRQGSDHLQLIQSRQQGEGGVRFGLVPEGGGGNIIPAGVETSFAFQR